MLPRLIRKSWHFVWHRERALRRMAAMSEPKQPPAPITPSAPAPDKLTPDEFMAKLAANPRFRVIEPSGKGFIIGGQHPAQGKR
jgi:hypothetical protein